MNRERLKKWAKVLLVLAYLISPLDLAPEAILGPLGYADDGVLLLFALWRLLFGAKKPLMTPRRARH
ncbi:MAG: DUF1232 domain-containing protein [Bdellovibrionales bacterium]|nr:DUF1232 domain-containing protein [Bdellovibrionales bacterium]